MTRYCILYHSEQRVTMLKAVLIFTLAVIIFQLPVSQATAHLLASKTILNEYAVDGKDLTVQYTIYNVGTSVAENIEMVDESFSPHEFEIVHGLLNVSWDRLPNNANVTHTVILRPLSPGLYNMSWAKLTYDTGVDGIVQVGYTSAPGYYRIVTYPEFSRKHSSHITEWIAFFLMSTPTLLLPFFLWYTSHSKYEKLKSKKA